MNRAGIMICFLTLWGVPAYGGGIFTLMELGKQQAAMDQALDEEDLRYREVKKAIESGRLITGMSSTLFEKTYGEPSVIVPERTGGTRWVYKPAEATYFAGERIYLFFSDDGTLRAYRIEAADDTP